MINGFTSKTLSALVSAGVLSVAAIVGTAGAASASPPAYCPTLSKEVTVFGIGGSTMGSVLGPMLDKLYKEEGVAFSRWGKASSGLARPDFHDWPKESPRLMNKHSPDIVIVSLGTNDYQALNDGKNWIRQEDDAWETTYGDRVTEMLTALGGENKERLVIWSGPYAFEGKNAVVRAPIVNRIMRERVEAYIADGGKALFHDAYGPTSDDNGKPLSEAILPSKGAKKQKIRGHDNIHLTADAVRELLAKPITDMTRPCIPAKVP